jgi:SAM-dependent methyltransferase
MELLIGAGQNKKKKLMAEPMSGADWKELVTLDFNAEHNPDVVHDLTKLPLPFADNTFDEIHAYEVLEHTGQQGDFKFFFDQWSDFWRILKPDGFFFGTSPAPTSAWVWGDPGHTRTVAKEHFVFLSQIEYKIRLSEGRPMTDYRFCYLADFDSAHLEYQGETFIYVLQAIKPARVF